MYQLGGSIVIGVAIGYSLFMIASTALEQFVKSETIRIGDVRVPTVMGLDADWILVLLAVVFSFLIILVSSLVWPAPVIAAGVYVIALFARKAYQLNEKIDGLNEKEDK